MIVGRFLGGVAGLVYDPAAGRYLLLKRANSKDSGAGEWECVTGRVDQGEGFEQALRREIREEIGCEQVHIDFIIGTTHFYRGAATPDNELLGVKYFCTLDGRAQVRLSDEHSEARWLTAGEIRALLPGDHWLVETVTMAEAFRQLASADLLALLRANLNGDR